MSLDIPESSGEGLRTNPVNVVCAAFPAGLKRSRIAFPFSPSADRSADRFESPLASLGANTHPDSRLSLSPVSGDRLIFSATTLSLMGM